VWSKKLASGGSAGDHGGGTSMACAGRAPPPPWQWRVQGRCEASSSPPGQRGSDGGERGI
jgi:hypothetical protein